VKPGVYNGLTMGEYLALPALSAGVARRLVDLCPLAAWFDSPLNAGRPPDDTEASDVGTIAHGLLLEGDLSRVAVIDPNDHPAKTTGAIPEGWTNKSIRDARAAARDNGLVPVLKPVMGKVSAMLLAANAYIAAVASDEPAVALAFAPDGGESEVTYVWQEGGTLCKARADRVSADGRIVVDYKTTSGSVEPESWTRNQLVGNGYYFSAAWYRRGIKAVTGAEPAYVFLAQEVEPPHLCALIGCDPSLLALGDEKVDAALAAWARCQRDESWPGYAPRVHYAAAPAWEQQRWFERTDRDSLGIPYDPAKLFAKA
jgi:PDDEXK-like domain of unknown function (DUF3799)